MILEEGCIHTDKCRSEKECVQRESEMDRDIKRKRDRATEGQKHKPEGISSWIHTDCQCSVTTKGKMDGALWEPQSFLVAVVHLVWADWSPQCMHHGWETVSVHSIEWH